MATFWVLGLLILTALTERVGYNIDRFPIVASLFFVPPTLLFLFVRGTAAVHIRTMQLCSAYVAVVILSSLMNGADGYVKYTAVWLNIALVVPFAICFPVDEKEYSFFLKRIAYVGMIFAILSILQFFGQFLITGKTLFTLEGIVPEQFRVDTKSMFINPISFGSSILRSNGFVFPEAAGAGAFIGRILVLSVSGSVGISLIAIQFVGLIVTYSIIGFSVILVYFSSRFLKSVFTLNVFSLILAIGLVLIVTAAIFTIPPEYASEYISRRSGEFSSTNSSAYYRFVGPVELIWETLQNRGVAELLIGSGIGSSDRFRVYVPQGFVPPPLVIVLYESGIVGLVLFCSIIWLAFGRASKSFSVRLSMFVFFIIVDPSTNVPANNFVAYFMLSAIYRIAGGGSSQGITMRRASDKV